MPYNDNEIILLELNSIHESANIRSQCFVWRLVSALHLSCVTLWAVFFPGRWINSGWEWYDDDRDGWGWSVWMWLTGMTVRCLLVFRVLFLISDVTLCCLFWLHGYFCCKGQIKWSCVVLCEWVRKGCFTALNYTSGMFLTDHLSAAICQMKCVCNSTSGLSVCIFNIKAQFIIIFLNQSWKTLSVVIMAINHQFSIIKWKH